MRRRTLCNLIHDFAFSELIYFSLFRKFTQKFMETFLKLIYVPLLIVFVMYKNKVDAGFIHAYMVVTCTILLGNLTKNLYKSFLDGVICVNASILLCFVLRYDQKNYWLIQLVLLFLINNFMLPKISQKFTIPKIDLNIVSLVFLNIFLINAFFV